MSTAPRAETATPQRRGSTPATIESRATRAAVAAFLGGAVLTVTVMWGTRLPLAGTVSLGNIAAWCAGGGAGLAFASAYLIESRRGRDEWRRRLSPARRACATLALTAAFAMLCYLAIMAIASLFQLGFQGLTVDALGGGVLAGAAAAAMTYIGSLSGSQVSSESIAVLATLQLFIGTMASMVSSPDASWWQLHFSQLGNEAGLAGYRFNVSLILTGFALTALATYIGRDLERGLSLRGSPDPRLVRVLTRLFTGIGLCMVIVGSVPDAVNIYVHVGSATGMLILFGALVAVALRRIVDVPRDLVVFSILVVVGIVIAVLLWVPIGYYNLTGTEFMAASLLFAWLMVFVRTMRAYGGGQRGASGVDRGPVTQPAGE